MRYIVDEPLANFEPWGGAQGIFLRLRWDEIEIIGDYLDENPMLTNLQVNDFLWFEVETICEILGITKDDLFDRVPRLKPYWWSNTGW